MKLTLGLFCIHSNVTCVILAAALPTCSFCPLLWFPACSGSCPDERRLFKRIWVLGRISFLYFVPSSSPRSFCSPARDPGMVLSGGQSWGCLNFPWMLLEERGVLLERGRTGVSFVEVGWIKSKHISYKFISCSAQTGDAVEPRTAFNWRCSEATALKRWRLIRLNACFLVSSRVPFLRPLLTSHRGETRGGEERKREWTDRNQKVWFDSEDTPDSDTLVFYKEKGLCSESGCSGLSRGPSRLSDSPHLKSCSPEKTLTWPWTS